MEASKNNTNKWKIFLCSIFFVMGFSIIFSLLGVLLQTLLLNTSYMVKRWLGYVGGAIIILFGLYLLGLIKIGFLEREHKFSIKKKFKSSYATAFVFGAAFGVGWTPCVGAVLGAVLTLAVTKPSMAFFLLLTYSLGLGLPFLLVGLFTNQAQKFINSSARWLKYATYFFGLLLIALGILVFTSQLSRVANLAFASEFLISLNVESVAAGTSLNLSIAFLAGLVSFLSPCVLPLIPAFLTYLASTVATQKKEDK